MYILHLVECLEFFIDINQLYPVKVMKVFGDLREQSACETKLWESNVQMPLVNLLSVHIICKLKESMQ